MKTWKEYSSNQRIMIRNAVVECQYGMCAFCFGILHGSQKLEVHHDDKNTKNNNFKNLAVAHIGCHRKYHSYQ